tara:strand:- start:101 stop:289 length:189 start_codon:yes stop_codon:yes gene_type:complete
MKVHSENEIEKIKQQLFNEKESYNSKILQIAQQYGETKNGLDKLYQQLSDLADKLGIDTKKE